MTRQSRRLLCILTVILVVAGGGLWEYYRHPPVNAAQARAILPVVDAYLARDPDRGSFGGALSASLHPREYCDASIIEVRPAGRRWRAGLQINCGEFARKGRNLVEGADGYPGIADLATLTRTGDRYHLDSLTFGPPWADSAWVDQNFSHRAALWILSSTPPTAPDPIGLARKGLGAAAGRAGAAWASAGT